MFTQNVKENYTFLNDKFKNRALEGAVVRNSSENVNFISFWGWMRIEEDYAQDYLMPDNKNLPSAYVSIFIIIIKVVNNSDYLPCSKSHGT